MDNAKEEVFNIGDEVDFNSVYGYYADSNGIPKKLIIHGIPSIGENPKAVIVDKYEQYYIVNYTNSRGKPMQLGYLSKNLKLVKRKERNLLNEFQLF